MKETRSSLFMLKLSLGSKNSILGSLDFSESLLALWLEADHLTSAWTSAVTYEDSMDLVGWFSLFKVLSTCRIFMLLGMTLLCKGKPCNVFMFWECQNYSYLFKFAICHCRKRTERVVTLQKVETDPALQFTRSEDAILGMSFGQICENLSEEINCKCHSEVTFTSFQRL